MKTYIAIPDEIIGEAQSVAKALGMSSNDLYVETIRQYIDRKSNTLNREAIRVQLDKFYADDEQIIQDEWVEYRKTD